MDARTRIHSENQGLLPVSVGDTKGVEAYQRSPTLMAGDEPGSQGSVRIWAPSRKKLWATCIGSALGAILVVVVMGLTKNFGLGYGVISLLAGFLFSARALRRPCYVTTDEAGIGITTSHSSRALRWSEINTARIPKLERPFESHYVRLRLRAPDPVDINLTGYPDKQKEELLGLITCRADLRPHPSRPGLFMHPARPLPEAEALMGDGDRDIRDLLMAGRLEDAYWAHRKRYAVSAKEARQAVEALDLRMQFLAPEEVLRARLPDEGFRSELRALLRKGKKDRATGILQKRTRPRVRGCTDTIALLESLPLYGERGYENRSQISAPRAASGRTALTAWGSPVAIRWAQLTLPSQQAFEAAEQYVLDSGEALVTPEYLLASLAGAADSLVSSLLRQWEVSHEEIDEAIRQSRRGAPPETSLRLSIRTKQVLSLAAEEAHGSSIGPEHLLLGIARQRGGAASDLLLEHGLGPVKLRRRLQDQTALCEAGRASSQG